MAEATIQKTKAAGKGKWAAFQKNYLARWQLYLFLLLPIAYVIIFNYIPMAGIQIAFKKFDMTKGIWGSPWTGLANFKRFFSAYNFWNILWNTLSLALYGLIAGFPLPILLALLINAFPGQKFKKLVQTVSYMPHFISTVVIVGMLVQLFNPRTGAFGTLAHLFTGQMVTTDLLASPKTFPHMYVWSGVWQGVGWGSIVYIAALAGVDSELHEAAEIDGATRWQRVLKIDLPSILPTATIMPILNAGGIMNVGFEKVYLMQNSLNISRSEVISTYVYKVGLQIAGGDFSFATAIGLFNSVINFILLITVNTVTKKLGNTSLW